MTHRYLISQDSPALYITVVTKDRLPVFQKDRLKEVLCNAIQGSQAAIFTICVRDHDRSSALAHKQTSKHV